MHNREVAVIAEMPRRHTHPIRPRDIDEQLLGVFGKHEIEVVAGRLIRFFKDRGGWCPFSISELQEYYRDHDWPTDNMFFGLTGAWYDDSYDNPGWRRVADIYLAFFPDGTCYVTEAFIRRCARAL